MASVESASKSVVPPRRTLLESLWQRWLRKRQRDRVRQLSTVRFRLTREGVHFIGVLLFIFVGAVIRDINLLILLAGAMIGLLLLQWRFNVRTLLGLTATRRTPDHTMVGKETELFVTISNPKHWLGSWVVMVEDPLHQVLPSRRRLPDKGLALVDEVKPKGASTCKYQLAFHQRGRYRVGPSTLSTRFPIGLGRGWCTLDNVTEITVRPAQGELTPLAAKLFQQERQGQAKSSSKSGVHEAEFYGLRPWESGDSRRWIHWRTTARLGELSVRQFEQQRRRQVSVLLDLYRPVGKGLQEWDSHVELAISFLATLASATAAGGRDKLAVAVAGRERYVSPSVQSAVLVNNLLDQLAVVHATEAPDLMESIRGLGVPILANPYLLVVSTREDQTAMLRELDTDSFGRRLIARLQVKWLNVSKGDLEPYFSWTPPR